MQLGRSNSMPYTVSTQTTDIRIYTSSRGSSHSQTRLCREISQEGRNRCGSLEPLPMARSTRLSKQQDAFV